MTKMVTTYMVKPLKIFWFQKANDLEPWYLACETCQVFKLIMTYFMAR